MIKYTWLTSIAMVTTVLNQLSASNGFGGFGTVDSIVNTVCIMLLNQIHQGLYKVVCKPCDKCMDNCSKKRPLKHVKNLDIMVNAGSKSQSTSDTRGNGNNIKTDLGDIEL